MLDRRELCGAATLFGRGHSMWAIPSHRPGQSHFQDRRPRGPAPVTDRSPLQGGVLHLDAPGERRETGPDLEVV